MQVHTLGAVARLKRQGPKPEAGIHRCFDIMPVLAERHSADTAIYLEQLAPRDYEYATLGPGKRQAERLRLGGH
jgi:hypothetical protein